MNSHHMLRLSSMQFGLDDRVEEPLVALPDRPRRLWRRRRTETGTPEGAGADRPAATTPQPMDGGRR